MAVTTPPAPQKAPPKEKPSTGKKVRRPEDQHWAERLARSSYFLGAVALHIVIFLLVAGTIIFPRVVPPTTDFKEAFVPAGAPPPPPPSTPQQTMPVPTKNVAMPTAITVPSAMPSFTVPLPNLTPTPTLDQKMTEPPKANLNNLAPRLPGIKSLMNNFRDMGNIREANGDAHNIMATFPVYVASYSGGDWDCNTSMKAGAITAGSMPNLVDKINEWSHHNIKGEVEPKPLLIGGPALTSKPPPFIFFTGHKDFILTDQEIQNLRAYLAVGGAIWGDNALAGYGSRFDVAFRREMKRVLSDADKNFEPVPLTHDIFAKSYYNITRVPSGMNYYSEPLQKIDIDGKLAVIYTPNDYSDLYCMHILPGDKEYDTSYDPPKFTLFTYTVFMQHPTFFRNFTLESALAANQLGMNIIAFLLMRFDQDLLLAP